MALSNPISGNGAPLAPANADPLAELRDIHLPTAIDAWPPAIGWWLLAVLGIVAVIAIVYGLWRYWRANRYRREALAQLQQLRQQYKHAASDYLYHYTNLLKRVALTRYPRAQVAGLTGEAWVAFLDATSGSQEFSMGTGQVLIQGQYQTSVAVDIDALQKLGEHWIKRHRDLPQENKKESKALSSPLHQKVSPT